MTLRHTDHFIVKCLCEKIIAQCPCKRPDKYVHVQPCEDCKKGRRDDLDF